MRAFFLLFFIFDAKYKSRALSDIAASRVFVCISCLCHQINQHWLKQIMSSAVVSMGGQTTNEAAEGVGTVTHCRSPMEHAARSVSWAFSQSALNINQYYFSAAAVHCSLIRVHLFVLILATAAAVFCEMIPVCLIGVNIFSLSIPHSAQHRHVRAHNTTPHHTPPPKSS